MYWNVALLMIACVCNVVTVSHFIAHFILLEAVSCGEYCIWTDVHVCDVSSVACSW